MEISARAVVADNIVAANGGNGMKINNSSSVDIWNNTVLNNVERQLWIVQDARQASQPVDAGPRPAPAAARPDGDLAARAGGAEQQRHRRDDHADLVRACFQDSTLYRTATAMGLRPDGNAYYRVATNNPALPGHLAGRARATRRVYATVAAFRAGAGQEQNGTEFSGPPIVDGPTARRRRCSPSRARSPGRCRPRSPPSMGAPAGERQLGARFD